MSDQKMRHSGYTNLTIILAFDIPVISLYRSSFLGRTSILPQYNGQNVQKNKEFI